MAKKSCKKGYYYCFTDKKCKRIPKGWHVMSSTGRLMRDSEHQDENKEETNGKKKNGNGNGANGNGNGNGESNGGSNGGGVSESKDHEVAMAQSQLKKSAKNIAKLRKALGKKEKDIPAWMQAKITDTAHDTDAAAGYADKMDEEVISEKRDGKSAKSKGYSLRDWFKGGGWVQAGGKYDGKPCAKQPGQKTKPFCRDADDRANMSKKERSRRAAKKRREDPNPDRKGKAKMVSASYSNWRSDLEKLDEIAPAIAAGAALGIGAGGMYIINKLRQQKKKSDQGQGDGGLVDRLNKRKQMLQQLGNSYQPEGEVVTERDAWGTGPRDIIRCADGICRTPQEIEKLRQQNLKKKGITLDKAHYEPEGQVVEGNIGYSNPAINGKSILNRKGKPVSFNKAETDSVNEYRKASKKAGRKIYADEPLPEETEIMGEGKKDACYHKVKSRYSVWPSAYASGALVKCRKVGAKNWGNKTKKESYEFSNWRDDFEAMEFESVDIIKTEPLQPTQGVGSDMLDEKKRLMNKLDKISGQLRKASAMHKKQSQEVAKVSQHLCAGSVKHEEFGMGQCIFGQHAEPDENGFVSHYDVQFEHGIVENVSVEDMEVLTITEHDHYEMEGDLISEGGKKCWKGYKKAGTQKLFGKTYNRCVKAHFSDWRADMELQEDWQKSNRKDGVDGMSQKSVNAYKRENPGSKLQTAVTEKKPTGKRAKRRSSYCSRSKGQKDMHNIDCTKTPDKKICKARKRWRC